MHAKDSDAVARYLLNETDARDLEIVARGLEDAFLSLTGDDDDRRSTSDERHPGIDPTTRRVPPLGGFNLTLLTIELRRMLRNRRTIIFALVFPAVMFLVFGSGSQGAEKVGEGNVSAYVMVSMALYGGALIAAATGAGVAVERALGWSRQLRLTPLHPTVYILVKAFVALVMGAVAIAGVNVIGMLKGEPVDADRHLDLVRLLTLVCVMTFAALGRLRRLPASRGRTSMQILGPGLALLAFLGGLFIPLSQYSERGPQIAYWTPMYGVAEVARAPLTHELPGTPWSTRSPGWDLRGRCRLADEQGHRPGVSATTVTDMAQPPHPGARAGAGQPAHPTRAAVRGRGLAVLPDRAAARRGGPARHGRGRPRHARDDRVRRRLPARLAAAASGAGSS